jgi:hypothetical protein
VASARVEEQRAQQRADRGGQDRQPEDELAAADVEPRQRQDDLGGNRWEDVLDEDQAGEAGIATAPDDP